MSLSHCYLWGSLPTRWHDQPLGPTLLVDSVELPPTDPSPIAGQPFAIQAVALVHPEPGRQAAYLCIGGPQCRSERLSISTSAWPLAWPRHLCPLTHRTPPTKIIPSKMHNLLVQLLQVHCLYSSFHYKGLTLRRHCFVLAVALCVGGHRSTSSASLSSKGLLSWGLLKLCPSTLHLTITKSQKENFVFLWLFVLRCAEYC